MLLHRNHFAGVGATAHHLVGEETLIKRRVEYQQGVIELAQLRRGRGCRAADVYTAALYL